MSEAERAAERPRKQAEAPQRRTDGKDESAGVAMVHEVTVPVEAQVQATVANSALKEAAKDGDGMDPQHPAAAHYRVLDADAGVVEPLKRKQIAVCGFASSSRGAIPVDDPTWEIWGLNQLYRHLRRADRWFDIHWNWNEEVVPGTDHRGWIKDCGIPVYMMQQQPDLPTSVSYPLEPLIAQLGADYFTSTIAYMVALAIAEIDADVDRRLAAGESPAGATSVRQAVIGLYNEYAIGVFGVDLAVGEEYFWQKACAEYWIGVASARGIRVMIPPQSALCKQRYRYGFEKAPAGMLNSDEVGRHLSHVSKERDELIRRLHLCDGAMQADEFWKQLLELRERGVDAPMPF